MNFNNATLLTYNKRFEFLGNTTRFKSVKDLTVQGLLLDLTNSDGVSGIIAQLRVFQTDNDNWQDIVLNGYGFGKGIITKVDFSEGNDIRTKTYTVSISIPETGDFSSLTTGDYSNI